MKPSVRIVSSLLAATWMPLAAANHGGANPTQAWPVLTWNRIALQTVERAKPTQHQAVRLLAHVSIAQHVAISEAQSKEAARAAVGTASMKVIAAMFPAQAAFVQERHREFQANESAQGARIAARVLAQAEGDRFAQTWTAQVPQASYAWRSLVNPPAPPAYPATGGMRMFLADSAAAFRAAPPPAVGSARFAADLAEVRRVTANPTAESTRIAKFYDMTTGTLAGGFWNEQTAELIHANRLDNRRATAVLATLNATMMDALAACHDTKYTYWVPRPSQADPAIKPIIGVPNHPSYPSNHSCLSTSAAMVLAHFFPNERKRLEGIASEAGVSRIFAGLHYRFDVDAGEEIGRKIAAVAIARHHDMLAQWTQTTLSQHR